MLLRNLAFWRSQVDHTYTGSIATGSDDARERDSDTVMFLTDTALTIRNTRTLGLRFTGFDLTGATITAATIQFTCSTASTAVTNNSTFRCEIASNPGTFTSTNADISGRTWSTASVAVDWAQWATAGDALAAEKTGDLSTIVQEAVDNGSLTSLCFKITTSTSLTDERVFAGYEHATLASPELHLEWTA